MDDDLSKTWQRTARRVDATHEAAPGRTPLAMRARKLLHERYHGLSTQLELAPYELWILAEAIRLGMQHPDFTHTLEEPNTWDIARQLWESCRERLEELDGLLAEAMHRPG